MDIAFASGNPHLPQVVGGVEVNTHALAGELTRRGNPVCVLAKLSLRNRFGLVRAARLAATRSTLWLDHDLGYPVFRSQRPARDAGDLPRPAVAVVQNGEMLELAGGFARAGVPSVAYLHGLAFETWGDAGAASRLPFCGYIANSQFTAERFRRRFGLDAVVLPPLFRREDYATPGTGSKVVFVNPVAAKGVDLALRIAELCPEIPFVFVRAWPLGLKGEAALAWKCRRLGNVTLRDRVSDMREVYRETRILLVPSQWEDETWGRVVSEAQTSGIPVVASNRGGLPEAVGPGGVIIEHDAPARLWADAIRDLWSQKGRYDRLAAEALDHSLRPGLDPDCQVAALIGALERFVARKS